jgi:hypothetical protein
VDGSGLGSCSLVDFGVSGVGASVSVTIMFENERRHFKHTIIDLLDIIHCPVFSSGKSLLRSRDRD